MKHLLKNAREKKEIKTRELARLCSIDPALISKFESGVRFPTLKQLEILSSILDIPFSELKIKWIKDKIIQEFGLDEDTINALELILSEIKSKDTSLENNNLDYIFDEIEKLKQKLKNTK